MYHHSWMARQLNKLWAEVEGVLVVTTGPLLLAGGLISAIDAMSNHSLSLSLPWLNMAWAVARAFAITFWPAIGVEFLIQDYRAKKNIFGWLVLIVALGLVDVQVNLQYAYTAGHINGWGYMAWLDVSPLVWIAEVAILGVVLIVISKFIAHRGEEVPELPTVAAPIVTPAYYAPPEPPEPPTRPRRTPAQPVLRLASPTRQTVRRSDSGGASASRSKQVNRVVKLLLADPKISLTQLTEALGINRSTAVSYRNEAREIIQREYADAV